jgi:signal transduction histidine kinase/CheY-like chemotaxis protein/HPt (histidine-containing phosphotransfer) domain-containing protein
MKGEKQMSARLKVICAMSAIVTLLSASYLSVSIVLTQNSLYKTTEEDMMVVADIADEYITSKIELLKSDAVVVSRELNGLSEEELSATMNEEVEKNKNFLAFSALDKYGVVASSGHDSAFADILGSEFAGRAFQGDSVISGTVTVSDGDTVFFVCVPMEGERILAATVDGMFFSDILSKFKLWKTGYIFMVDGEGTCIASIRENWVRERINFFEKAQTDYNFKGIAAMMERMREGESFTGEYTVDGVSKLCAATPVRGSLLGWTLGVVAPISESPLSQVRNALFTTTLLLLIFCIGVAIVSSRWIARPIAAMSEQNTKLAELKKDAELASEAKSNFLANTSHEMRTPLNAIIGLSELTLWKEDLDPNVHENMSKIRNSGATLLGIIDDLLDISKIESGKFELVETEYDLPSVINDTVNLNIMRIGDKPIEFNIAIDEKIPAKLIGDELRVKQVWGNLLSNAFKYTKKGKVNWSLTYYREDDAIWLVSTVSDTGIGIRAKDVEKLFSDYNQVDVKSNRSIEGTGLGLSIVKRLSEMMGGDVQVNSIYGMGSTFIARLKQKYTDETPIGSEVADNLCNLRYTDNKSSAGTDLKRISLPHARVLIVDDMITNLDIAAAMMKPYGMAINCVTSGQKAIDLIRSGEHYDAIFMDHMMPEMDGIEAVRIIREELGTDYAKTVPIIALTANAIVGTAQKFLDNGFQAFLSKPVDVIKLDAAIKQWVRPQMSPFFSAASDRCGLDSAAAWQRFNGDQETYAGVLRSFAEYTDFPLRDLEEAIVKENLSSYAVAVHGIKSSSRGISAEQIGDLAEALEMAAKVGDLDYVLENHKAFIERVEALISDIKGLLAEQGDQKEKPDAGTSPNIEVLGELARACRNFRMDAVDGLIAELEKYDYETGNDLVVWLRHKVEVGDFGEIEEHIIEYLGEAKGNGNEAV